MKEVFPTTEFFGIHYMNMIQKDLRKMIISSKEDEWNHCYSVILDILKSDHTKLAKLDKIKSNPSYYAGYYLKGINGNFTVDPISRTFVHTPTHNYHILHT